MIRKVANVAMATVLAASCATSPSHISPTYVSPLQYQSYSCDQIRVELQRIGARVTEVTGQQQRAANNDALAMGVGLVLFWPALFFLATDNDKREELARLRGEYDALQQAGAEKDCSAQLTAASSAPTEAAAANPAVAPNGAAPTEPQATAAPVATPAAAATPTAAPASPH